MCGIFGLLNKKQSSILKRFDPNFVKAAFTKGYRRGPENSQYQKKIRRIRKDY